MSALPLIADMCSALNDVRFVPIADIQAFGSHQKEKPRDIARGFDAASRILEMMIYAQVGKRSRQSRTAGRLFLFWYFVAVCWEGFAKRRIRASSGGIYVAASAS